MQPNISEKSPDESIEQINRPGKLLGLFEFTEKTLCTIGSIALTIMAAVLGCGIVSRYVFGYPIPGVYDIVQLFLVWVVFLSFSFTQKEERHIRVEIILRLLSERKRLYFDLASTVFGCLFCILMSWQAAMLAWSSLKSLEYWPGLLRVPIYPSKIALFLGVAALGVRFFLDTKKVLRKIKGLPKSADV